MEPVTFDSHNHGKNKTLLLSVYDDTDYDTAQLVEIESGNVLFSVNGDGDLASLLFYCYLSDVFAGGADAFILSDEMQKSAKAFFTAREWEETPNRQIQALKRGEEVEVILL